MYKDENKPSALATYLSGYDYVVLDTCSLMDDNFPAWMDVLVASKEYWKDTLEVIIPKKCVEELKKHSRDKKDNAKRIAAKRALKIVGHARWHKIFTFYKESKNENFADNVIYTFASGKRIKFKVLIVTQDKTLASDLRTLNELSSQHGRYVDIDRINSLSELEKNPGETFPKPNERSTRSTYGKYRPKVDITIKEEKKTIAVAVEKKGTEDVIRFDRILSANLDNPNYPNNKKLGDIKKQLSALALLSTTEKDALHLAYNESQLISKAAALEAIIVSSVTPLSPNVIKKAEEPKIFLNKENKTEKVIKEPSKEDTPKVEVSKKLEQPVAPLPVVKKVWLESGRTYEEALNRALLSKGIIVRDPTVPYFALVHGCADLTINDISTFLSSVANLEAPGFHEGKLKQISIRFEKTDHDYRAGVVSLSPTEALSSKKTLKTEGKEEPIKVPSPKAKKVKEEKTKDVEKAKPVVVATISEETVQTAPKSVEFVPAKKPIPNAKTKEEPVAKPLQSGGIQPSTLIFAPRGQEIEKVNTIAVPSGATLIVGVPDDDSKRMYIERKSRRAELGTAEKKQPTKPKKTSSKKVETPKVSETKKTDETKKVSPKKKPSAPKKEVTATAKPADSKLAKVKAVSKKDEVAKPVVSKKKPAPKKTPKKEDSKVVETPSNAELAKKADMRLSAVLTNPNYSGSAALEDLKKQLDLIKDLTVAETKSLKFKPEDLKKEIIKREK